MAYEDLDFRPEPGAQGESPPPKGGPSRSTILVAVLIIALGVVGYFILRDRGTTAPDETQPVQSEEPAVPTEPLGGDALAVTVPPLDESDAAVRELVRALSSHPTVAAWLATDNLIRTFTVVVLNIADRGQPAGHAPTLRPRSRFLTETRGSEVVLSGRNYARYTALATAVSSVDPAGAARLYATLKPRIEEAYRDLGYPDQSFDRTLERAIVQLLQTPIPSGPVRLEPLGAEGYRFADPKLEALTPAQKALIRLGPDNARTVKTSLRNIALALGIPAERLP
jgi:hypothetical protein